MEGNNTETIFEVISIAKTEDIFQLFLIHFDIDVCIY